MTTREILKNIRYNFENEIYFLADIEEEFKKIRDFKYKEDFYLYENRDTGCIFKVVPFCFKDLSEEEFNYFIKFFDATNEEKETYKNDEYFYFAYVNFDYFEDDEEEVEE